MKVLSGARTSGYAPKSPLKPYHGAMRMGGGRYAQGSVYEYLGEKGIGTVFAIVPLGGGRICGIERVRKN